MAQQPAAVEFISRTVATFLGTLAALTIFAIATYLYVDYRVTAAIDGFRQGMKSVKK